MQTVKGTIDHISDMIKVARYGKPSVVKKIIILELENDNQIKIEFRGRRMVDLLKLLTQGDDIEAIYTSKTRMDRNRNWHQNNVAVSIKRVELKA